MKPKRVLHYGLLGGIGGVETFVINLYRYVDKERIQFDFLTSHDGRVAFGNEIVSGGGARIPHCLFKKRITCSA